ncbi:MAG: ABC transporter substrate-binding protein [Candidatus Paceibacterota bacterium]
MKKSIWWIVGIVVVILIIVAVSNKRPSETGPIKIGFIGPLSGDAAGVGEPVANGVRLAEKEINDAGGIKGRKIQVFYGDGKCDGPTAVSVAQKMISMDGVHFIIGGICSGEVLAAAPILEAAKVLSISPGATSPNVSNAGDYVFRNAPNDADRGVSLADYAAEHFTRIAAISEQTDYSQSLKKSFVDQLNVKGIQLVADETYNSESTDFRSILLKLKTAKPDVIFLNPQSPANLIRLAQQARTTGITAQFIASEFIDAQVMAAGAAVQGMIVSVAPGLSAEGRGGELLTAYKAMFGKDADYPYYVGAAYDNLHIFADGIAKYGEDTTLIKDYLYALEDYPGTIGTYSFDDDGNVVGVGFVFQKIVDGKAVPIE